MADNKRSGTGKRPASNANKRKAYVTNARDAKNAAKGTKSAAGSRSAGNSGSSGSSGSSRSASGRSAGSSSSAAGNSRSSGSSRSAGSRNAGTQKSAESRRKAAGRYEEHLKILPEKDDSIRDEIGIVIAILVCVLMFLSSLKLCGSFGDIVNKVVFGLFGSFGYAFPFVLFLVILFAISNKRNASIVSKIICCFLIMVDISAIVQLIAGGFNAEIGFIDYFSHSLPGYEGAARTYGGLLGGSVCKVLCPFLGNIGAGCVMFAGLIILLILILGKAILTAITHRSMDGIHNLRERNREKKEEREAERAREAELEAEYEDEYEEIEEFVRSVENHGTGETDPTSRAEYELNRKKRLQQLKLAEKRKRKEASEGFIDALMRRGMGLDLNRIEETPEYQALKESYGMTDYEMGELISDAIKEKDKENTTGLPAETPEDIIRRELDRKFGDSGKVQVINLREHSKVVKENSGNYFIDDNPDEDVNTDFDIDEDLKKQVANFYDDDPKSGDTAKTAANDTETGRNVKTDDKGTGTPAKTGTGSGKKGNDPDHEADDTETATAARDREASGATGFNTPEQIREVMEEAEARKKNPPYEFPPIDLLKKSEKSKGVSRNELEETVKKLQETFESFGVKVKVTDATCGPTVTRYELYPDQGVKVKTITALTDDIKLALAAPDIRIEAPIPGKAAVGIEVPNKTTTPVSLRDLIDSQEFREAKSNLTFAVGKDIGGKIVCADIAGMPHMLIAGSTGSGKSVCINAMILSIVYKSKPSDVRMIMVDPKRVELIGYNGIPHLLVPVVTDVKKAMGALNWAVAEMDDRYKRFEGVGVNNLASYNRLVEEKYYEEGGTEEECPERLPQIVIIIDELNDLMMTANSKEVELAIVRLTQLARACGIHLIIATQRPSVNVITGTIKANIPSRISFALSQVVDSRTILDQAGAEKLLGKGDMLFYPQGYPQPVRLQGAYVSDSEIKAVVDFIKTRCRENMYNDDVSRHIENSAAGDNKGGASADQGRNGTAPEDDRDEFFEEAGKLIIRNKKASIGAIQRAYRVGFNRAARIMDQLAESGVVGPDEGTKPRRILMTLEQFEAFIAGDIPDDPGENAGTGETGENADIPDAENNDRSEV